MQKLKNLRDLMKNHKIDAYIIPSADAHQSEYVTIHDKRRGWISGFDGSAGTALVTEKAALLWTDGRYFLQAEKQLIEPWKLMKLGIDQSINSYLHENLEKEQVIGIDGLLFSKDDYKLMQKETKVEVKLIEPNLIDEIWTDQPSYPSDEPFHLDIRYTGVSVTEKLKKIRLEMQKEKVQYLFLSVLDEIAWVLNMRGNDIPFCPLFLSYLLISANGDLTLFADKKNVSLNLEDKSAGEFHVEPYGNAVKALRNLPRDANVWIDPLTCSVSVFNAIQNPLEKESPIVLMKALKNPIELEGMRNCHKRDAVAVCKFLCWLEKEMKDPNQHHTECTVADKLEEFRKELKDFYSLSFETISGCGPSGAVIHYHPVPEACEKMIANSMFLLDSGGQYFDGTTDITRTVFLGDTPSDYMKDCFTRVLQGHIAIDSCVFPKGCTGARLDVLARNALWKVGKDFRHGVGHGVGHFLNVHEGPQGISGSRYGTKYPLEVGMTVTDEPGYYEAGKFGIRIENVLIVKEAKGISEQDFLGFEHITCVPLQTKLIRKELLSKEEIAWVNDYNCFCHDTVAPLIKDDAITLQWLKDNTMNL